MKRGMRIVWTVLIVFVMAMFSACAHNPTPLSEVAKAKSEEQPRVPNEYLVTLAPNVDEAIIFEYYRRFGLKYVHDLEEETYLVIVTNDPGPHEMEALIEEESRIKLVQPNLVHWDYR